MFTSNKPFYTSYQLPYDENSSKTIGILMNISIQLVEDYHKSSNFEMYFCNKYSVQTSYMCLERNYAFLIMRLNSVLDFALNNAF